MSTQSEKFKEIADAIRLRTGTEDEIIANEFAEKIIFMDTARPTTLYPDGLDNGYCGNLAAQTAASYHFAKVIGNDVFDYVQYTDNVFNVRQDPNNVNYLSARVRDEYGRGLLDCSSYIGLVLRGIKYDNSPFKLYKDADARWYPAAATGGLLDMYGNAGWEFKILDKQPEGEWRNFGFEGYSTPRKAGHIAEFFYKYGWVLYDIDRDGSIIDDTGNLNELGEKVSKMLCPGDIIFMSNYEIDFNMSSRRYHSVSHIAMVAENTSKFFHVTGTDDNEEENEGTVFYSDFTSRSSSISLICRPNYLHGGLSKDVPIGVNLLHYPWTFGFDPYTYNDTITIEMTNDYGVLHLSGSIPSDSDYVTIKLNGDPNKDTHYVQLSPGQYTLSGTENTNVDDASIQIQIRYHDSAELIAKCYGKTSTTFEITETTKVYTRLYISNKNAIDCNITPTLIRVS